MQPTDNHLLANQSARFQHRSRDLTQQRPAAHREPGRVLAAHSKAAHRDRVRARKSIGSIDWSNRERQRQIRRHQLPTSTDSDQRHTDGVSLMQSIGSTDWTDPSKVWNWNSARNWRKSAQNRSDGGCKIWLALTTYTFGSLCCASHSLHIKGKSTHRGKLNQGGEHSRSQAGHSAENGRIRRQQLRACGHTQIAFSNTHSGQHHTLR